MTPVKRIFIGSSVEGLKAARGIAAALARMSGVTPIIWTRAFEPGYVTIEQIERLAREISGAVLVASPDTVAEVRGERVLVPSANVMLELGYFMAILGRKRVALCRSGNARLPSDLDGYTWVGVDGTTGSKMRRWIEQIPAIAPGIPATTQWHGYSGSWSIVTRFTKWRGISLRGKSRVWCRSTKLLQVSDDGNSGRGLETGTLYVKLPGCYAEFEVTDEITNVRCRRNGELLGVAAQAG